MTSYKTFTLPSGTTWSFLGPPLELGPMPALFYFALSFHESLGVDPFNQPVVHLAHKQMRIFSIDLPAHGHDLPATKAIGAWADAFNKGDDPLTPFIEKIVSSIDELLKQNLLIEKQIGVIGLSRGGLIACHVAAKLPFIRYILGFAPLTHLSFSIEFAHLKDDPQVQAFAIENLKDQLYDRHIRFYIGNRDLRVETSLCFESIKLLVETAFHHKIRSPQIELMISPSIGHLGHGTPKETFEQGADWIASKLGAAS
jgi:predicted esterase